MRIVVDMQGAQTASRSRGIGRYTLSLAQSIARRRGEHEIILALNGLFPETIESIRACFDGLLPQENIRVWHAPGPLREWESGNALRRENAELIREAFLASLRPDVVHVTSLFEGYMDDAATSIARFDRTTPTCVTLYDLIPLLNPDHYLTPDPAYHQYYLRKIEHLRQASQLLAISESSRQEGIEHLGLPVERVTNISCAVDARFRPTRMREETRQALLRRYRISRPFVMYTGATDSRKNIEGLIRAYALLPKALREQHQLVVVCELREAHDRLRLERLGAEQKLGDDELVLTGFVPDEDLLLLYNLCKMFVFPSWHEGFGLPALEAMACGRAVIGANTSSLPEVIGRNDALFSPRDDQSIADKMEQVLNDDAFRADLERHGLEQAKRFSWDAVGQRAIAALEECHASHSRQSTANASGAKPRLAYVSPLLPSRSGISYYSSELLPELARHYDIDVIVAQDDVSDPWANANCVVRSVSSFLERAADYDRVLYHVGNSPFHQHMFELMEKIPGTVALHDFFLSGIVEHMDTSGAHPGSWARELYHSHGYDAVRHRFHAADIADVGWIYPCNLSVLKNANGIIVHSESSRRLLRNWYGDGADGDCAVIPHLRVPMAMADRADARRTLKLGADDFVVCSFGMLWPNKLNHSLLDSWLMSALAKDARCILVFVGENPTGEYAGKLIETIQASGLGARIRITGWADEELFRNYLAAADVAVQLRTMSRGETSGTVLDCMNAGLPTIVNAHGSLADLQDEAIYKLPDQFTNVELAGALEDLWRDDVRRGALSSQAQNIIRTCHAPRTCADLYAQAIEEFHRGAAADTRTLTDTLAKRLPFPPDDRSLIDVAKAISLSIAERFPQPQLLVDISELAQRDSKSGIQRVVRSILLEWLLHPPQGFRVEPIYASAQHGYRYARSFTLKFLDCPASLLPDEPIEFRAGDRFVGLDLQSHVVLAQQDFYQCMRRQGVHVQFLVYDLLPLLMPDAFVDGAAALHHAWLRVVAACDGALCISKAVADEFIEWQTINRVMRLRPFEVGWFHLGSDLKASAPTKGMPDSAQATLENIRQGSAFLVIGTVEPRKGHAQTLAAFESLWARGVDVVLVIVGRAGWLVDGLIEKLRNHAEYGRRLLWLEGISDEYLEELYAACTCLIAPSQGEGFGLPLIEAAQGGLPIIARDIPVFREVAGDHAFYFSGNDPQSLAHAVEAWLVLRQTNAHPDSSDLPWLTWGQSAAQLLPLVLPDREQPCSRKITLRATGASPLRQLLVDVSTISRNDLHTGIERVVRAQLSRLLHNPPDGFRVEPVYLSNAGGTFHYCYARRYACKLLGKGMNLADDTPLAVGAGDIFYGADFCPADVANAADSDIYAAWHNAGVRISFLIHDILPVLRPEFFPENTDHQHARWLERIADNADSLICISRSVADELSGWLRQHRAGNQLALEVLHHGADIAASFPSRGMPPEAAGILESIENAPSFLMVGTIEPRKGHLQALQAFEQLWKHGSQAMLVIVGREGWKSLPQHERRTIPHIIERLSTHAELGKRLIWLSDISDEYLQEVYAACTCLVFASEAEGFGLPLIEAAGFKKPIIARDIPVFREIAGEHAYFFDGLDADDLAHAIRAWLQLQSDGQAPSSDSMQWHDWAQNVKQLVTILGNHSG